MGSFLCGGSFGMPVVSASGLDAMLWNPKISSIRSDHLAKPSLEPLFSWNFPNFPRLGPLVSRVWGKVYRTPVFFLVIFTPKFPLILSGTKRPDCDGERKSDENLGGNGWSSFFPIFSSWKKCWFLDVFGLYHVISYFWAAFRQVR